MKTKGVETRNEKGRYPKSDFSDDPGRKSRDVFGADFWHLKGVERLGIPSVMVTDGPHGLRKQGEQADHLGINESVKAVCFPTGCATASSFDRQLLKRSVRRSDRNVRRKRLVRFSVRR